MDTLRGTESLFMIILSLLSQIIDIPNYTELTSEPPKKKKSTSSEESSSPTDHSSLVRRNVFFDITLAAKSLFHVNGDSDTGDSEIIFGRPLPKLIPTKLKKLLIFLKKHVFREGIFRISGSSKRIKELRRLLDAHGNVIDWEEQEDFNVHDAASVLKQYISELPKPILCGKQIPVHVEISKLDDGEKKLRAVQLVLLLLPEENRMFLKMLMMLLHEVSANTSNLMDSLNLGKIFAPHLLKSAQLDTATSLCLGKECVSEQMDELTSYTAYLIENSEKLFDIPAELDSAAEKYKVRMERGESCEDIPVEINSSCIKLAEGVHQEVVSTGTKSALITLYKMYEDMPEGKEKASRLKKFGKQYPHYIMELNNLSHSPMIRTKSTRKQIGQSLSRLISVKSSSTKGSSSPTASIASLGASFSVNNTVHNTSTPNKGPEFVVTTGTKRKALEMLQTSPQRYSSLSSFISSVCKRRKKEDMSKSMEASDQGVPVTTMSTQTFISPHPLPSSSLNNSLTR